MKVAASFLLVVSLIFISGCGKSDEARLKEGQDAVNETLKGYKVPKVSDLEQKRKQEEKK